MEIVVEHVGWLVVGVLVVGVAVALMVFWRRHSFGWKAVCVGLPLVAAGLVGLGMGGLGVRWEGDVRRLVMVLDMSGSARGAAWREPEWVRRLALARLGGKVRVDVVGFGDVAGVLARGLVVGDEKGWPTKWEGMELGSGSNVDAGLRWRAGEGLDRDPRWVVTDGLVKSEVGNGGKEWDFPVAVTVVPAKGVDVGVTEMKVEGGELLTELRATGKAKVEVELSAGGKVMGREKVEFAGAGGKWVVVKVGEGKEGAEYGARVLGSGAYGDVWPENDVGSVRWVPGAGGKLRVVRVGGAGGGKGGELGLGDVVVKNVGVEEVEKGSGEAWVWEGWQVVVLDDVATRGGEGGVGEVLSADGAGAVAEFVRGSGGGLVLRGVRRAFGPGGYGEVGGASGVLDGLSPVWSREPEKGAEVVIVVDGSASMNEGAGGVEGASETKFARASAAVVSALEELNIRDRVTVVVFGGKEARVIARGSVGEVKSGLAERLAKVQPGGGTMPDVVLGEVGRALGGEAHKKVVVFLTDGEIPKMDVEAWGKVVAEARATMAVVAPREASGGVVEKLVKAAGARWMGFGDAGEWRGLLARTVREPLAGKAESEAVKWVSVNDARGEKELSGVSRKWVEVWKKEEATLRAEGVRAGGEKVALSAVVQRGLGKVAGVAMEDEGMLGRMVREVAGEAGDRRFVVKAERAGAGWRVRVEGKDGKGGEGFLNGERMWVRVGGREERLEQIGPGVYEGRLDVKGAEVGVVTRESGENSGAGEGRVLVGVVRMAEVAGGEWPASVGAVGLPMGATELSGDEGVEESWRPGVKGRVVELREGLWVMAVVMGLGAMWVRRVRRG